MKYTASTPADVIGIEKDFQNGTRFHDGMSLAAGHLTNESRLLETLALGGRFQSSSTNWATLSRLPKDLECKDGRLPSIVEVHEKRIVLHRVVVSFGDRPVFESTRPIEVAIPERPESTVYAVLRRASRAEDLEFRFKLDLVAVSSASSGGADSPLHDSLAAIPIWHNGQLQTSGLTDFIGLLRQCRESVQQAIDWCKTDEAGAALEGAILPTAVLVVLTEIKMVLRKYDTGTNNDRSSIQSGLYAPPLCSPRGRETLSLKEGALSDLTTVLPHSPDDAPWNNTGDTLVATLSSIAKACEKLLNAPFYKYEDAGVTYTLIKRCELAANSKARITQVSGTATFLFRPKEWGGQASVKVKIMGKDYTLDKHASNLQYGPKKLEDGHSLDPDVDVESVTPGQLYFYRKV